jgi:hypothetical protein
MSRPLHAVLAVLTATLPGSGFAQSVDISGLPLFWKVYDHLVLGQEPPPRLLNSLFSTPGYAALEQRERRRARLTEAIRLAFLPRLGAHPDSLEAAHPWVRSIVPHLRRAATRRRELDSLALTFARDPVLRQADLRARGLLPAMEPAAAPPSVSFILFARDGRGYPHLVIADLERVRTMGDPERFFAHEFHHYHRHTLSRQAPRRTPGHGALTDVLTNLEFEGIADRLDKADIPALSDAGLAARFPDSSERAYYHGYREAFRRGVEWVALLDSTLSGLRPDSSSVTHAAALLARRLPDGGRVLGAFFASIIQQALGDRGLAAVAGDPPAFFAAYQRAATACSRTCRPLSREAARVLSAIYAGGSW